MSKINLPDPWQVKELDSGYIRISHDDYFNFCQIEKSKWPNVTIEEIKNNSLRPWMSEFIGRLHAYARGLQMGKKSVEKAFNKYE